MAGSPGGRQLVWIPVVIALGAMTLTGCKKTSHAVKPLTNISQAATATAPTSASSSPTAAAPASASVTTPASASVTAPSAVASLSATIVPVAPPAAKTGTGCTLIPLTAVASALGVASVTTKTYVTTLHPPIVAHQGCQYLAGASGAGWDINTFSTGAPPQALLAIEMAKVPGAKQTTIDGLPGYAIVLPGGTGEEEVALYKGQEDIVILTHGKTGASVALAQLIAAAI
jgi:hypothetical protein